MIWWILFIAITLGASVAALRFVPPDHRKQAVPRRNDGAAWLAYSLAHSIWIVAAAQNLIAASLPPPAILRLFGAALMVGGHAFVVWAWRVNPFFLPAIVAPDYVVTKGPYKLMNHPGYLGMSLVAVGNFFLLGQLWAFFPTFGYLCLLARRIHIEERLLSAHFQR